MNLTDLLGTSKTGWHTDNPQQPSDITGLIPCDPERKKTRLPDGDTGENTPAPAGEKSPAIPEKADIPASGGQTTDTSNHEVPQNHPGSPPASSEIESNDISHEPYKKAVEDKLDDISKDAGEDEKEQRTDIPENAEIPPESREESDTPSSEDPAADISGHGMKKTILTAFLRRLPIHRVMFPRKTIKTVLTVSQSEF